MTPSPNLSLEGRGILYPPSPGGRELEGGGEFVLATKPP